jgi:hypothetical protein
VFYTFLEYSPDIPRAHYRIINARDEFFYFFYNISRRYYIVNNFTQKIDVEILLTYTQWRHAHAFTVAWIFKRAKEQHCQNNIQTFDAIKPEKLFKIMENKKTVIDRLICRSFSASGLLDLPWRTVNRRFHRVYTQFFEKLTRACYIQIALDAITYT